MAGAKSFSVKRAVWTRWPDPESLPSKPNEFLGLDGINGYLGRTSAVFVIILVRFSLGDKCFFQQTNDFQQGTADEDKIIK